MNRLIAHGLVKVKGKYILIKRTKIKRGKPNSFPEYWDIPGGMVEPFELPQEAVVRETKEEVNLDVRVKHILNEDSNYDSPKDTVFTRLVYLCELIEGTSPSIVLQDDEHSDYILIDDLSEMSGEKLVDYLPDVFKNL